MSVCCVQWRTLTDSDQRPASEEYKYENTRENTEVRKAKPSHAAHRGPWTTMAFEGCRYRTDIVTSLSTLRTTLPLSKRSAPQCLPRASHFSSRSHGIHKPTPGCPAIC
jgi:hypothetical protein